MKSLLSILFCWLVFAVHAQNVDQRWVEENYTQREVMIPMRDGVKLSTMIFEPKEASHSPILMHRTPYGNRMFSTLWADWKSYAKEKYIFVVQDVRGRFLSEGSFVNVRPFVKNKHSKKDIDETTDAYDTVEWLLKHLKHTNGRVGVIGCSYPGFYATMAAASGHPAIKAVSPQAPVTDWFMGDDYHRHGAFMLRDEFSFCPWMDAPRPKPTSVGPVGHKFFTTDEYSFFLKKGAISELTPLLGDSIAFWNEVMSHPNYDEWWRERDARRVCYHIKPAVLIVGGTYDAEDCFGAWNTYKAIRRQSPSTDLRLVMGPWSHGAWLGSLGHELGDIHFGGPTAPFYRDSIEFPFFQHYLNGKPLTRTLQTRVHVFSSGENRWHGYQDWDVEHADSTIFYLQEKGGLSVDRPTSLEASCTEYVSDPSHPVPYWETTVDSRNNAYMTADQRFAARRPDVLCFETAPLTKDFSVAGPVQVDLQTAISTTDADFVVKVIDVFPDDFSYSGNDGFGYSPSGAVMGGYQMLVRGDVMRGRFRESYSHVTPFVPGKVSQVSFVMNDIAHTFKAGHRLMVQVQSSWFPLVDMNPQQCVDNIYKCGKDAFVKSHVRIYHDSEHASRLTFYHISTKE